MRLVFDRRAGRLLRRIPRCGVRHVAGAIELGLLALLAVQAARLAHAIVTPVGPLGDWRADSPSGMTADVPAAPLGAVDPFFRLSAADGPVVVTGLDLKLFGIRSDQASGRGSAIIGLPDGSQASYAVGDTILPGVVLKAVAFDSITVARGGRDERLFLDQSRPATPIAAPPAPVPGPLAPSAAAPSARIAATELAARMDGGRITGFTLRPRGSGDAFRAAGLMPGDVLVAVDGMAIDSAEAAARARDGLAGRTTGAVLTILRAGQTLTIRLGAAS